MPRKEKFLLQDLREYDLQNSIDIKKWFNYITKNGYYQFATIGELQFLINSIVLWYELKYPEKVLELNKILKKDYNNIIDHHELSRIIHNYEYNTLLRDKVIKLFSIILMNSNNSNFNDGYLQPKKMIEEFNLELNANFVSEDINIFSKKNNSLSLKRMLELEKYLEGKISLDNIDENDKEYLKLARMMPFNEFVESIYYYRKNAQWLSIAKDLISYLASEYSYNDEVIKKRLDQVKRLYKYEQNLLNKLCSDNKKMIRRLKGN